MTAFTTAFTLSSVSFAGTNKIISMLFWWNRSWEVHNFLVSQVSWFPETATHIVQILCYVCCCVELSSKDNKRELMTYAFHKTSLSTEWVSSLRRCGIPVTVAFTIKMNYPCTYCMCPYEVGVTDSAQVCISHSTFTLSVSLTSYFQYLLGKLWHLTTIIHTPLIMTVWKCSNPPNTYPLFPKTSHYVVSVHKCWGDKWEKH